MGIKIINLPDLSGLPENGDYFALTDGTVTSKINYQLLAQAIIEQYNGSSLLGSEQSVQNALSFLNAFQWKYLGNALSEGTTFQLPETEAGAGDTYLLITAHNSTGWLNTVWVLRPGSESSTNVYKLSEGAMRSSAFTYASGYAQYASGNVVIRRNNVCSLHLVVKNLNAVTFGNTAVKVCTLPEGFWPEISHTFIQQGSNKNWFRCEINTSGEVLISRYGTTATAEAGSGSWLNCDCTFVAQTHSGVNVTLTDRRDLNISTLGGGVAVYVCKMPTVVGSLVDVVEEEEEEEEVSE